MLPKHDKTTNAHFVEVGHCYFAYTHLIQNPVPTLQEFYGVK